MAKYTLLDTKKLALKIAESNKGSVNEGAVASFAEGVRILYGK